MPSPQLASNGQAFAWVSVDEADNDPKVLLTYVAKALDAVEPVGERVFDAPASPDSSVPGSVIPRLGSAFSSMASPVALVLDDVHALHNSQCQAALSMLADHVPGGPAMPPGSFWRITSIMYLAAAHLMAVIQPGPMSFSRMWSQKVRLAGSCSVHASRWPRVAAGDRQGRLGPGQRYLAEARSLAREGKLEDYPRSRSCTRWPRGWRCMRPTVRAPRRN